MARYFILHPLRAVVAAIFPLALTEGAESLARNSMGIAVVGGMTVATLMGFFLTPVLYLAIAGRKVERCKNE